MDEGKIHDASLDFAGSGRAPTAATGHSERITNFKAGAEFVLSQISQKDGTDGNEVPQYLLIVTELSLLQLNATRTFLQSVGLHCAVENYRDPLTQPTE